MGGQGGKGKGLRQGQDHNSTFSPMRCISKISQYKWHNVPSTGCTQASLDQLLLFSYCWLKLTPPEPPFFTFIASILHSLPPHEMNFWSIWTVKEALFKKLKVGIAQKQSNDQDLKVFQLHILMKLFPGHEVLRKRERETLLKSTCLRLTQDLSKDLFVPLQ